MKNCGLFTISCIFTYIPHVSSFADCGRADNRRRDSSVSADRLSSAEASQERGRGRPGGAVPCAAIWRDGGQIARAASGLVPGSLSPVPSLSWSPAGRGPVPCGRAQAKAPVLTDRGSGCQKTKLDRIQKRSLCLRDQGSRIRDQGMCLSNCHLKDDFESKLLCPVWFFSFSISPDMENTSPDP